jgi:transcriptional regulator with XRE-family HTH domain
MESRAKKPDPTADDLAMAARIKDLRVRISQGDERLVQERLAPLLDVSIKTISRWETGESKPSRANLAKLAELGGVTPYWLEHGIQPTLDRSTADDDPPTDQDDVIADAANAAGIGEEGARQLRVIRRSIGPMPRGLIYSTAETIASNMKTEGLAFPKGVDKAQTDTPRDSGLQRTNVLRPKS